MSLLVHTDYYHDTMEIRYCSNCQKRFAVGEELARAVSTIFCPYCCSDNNEAVAWNEEDLGCGGINFHKTDNRYYDRCLYCKCELTSENIAFEAMCKACNTRQSAGNSTPDSDSDIKTILQGELQNYRPSGWNIPGNYRSWAEYMGKSVWYGSIKDEEDRDK